MTHKRNTIGMFASARCGAKTRSGRPCRAPCVFGKVRCRMHGGSRGSGAPPHNQNALINGAFTREAIRERSEFRALITQARKTVADLAKEL